jgi:hypothetical protein
MQLVLHGTAERLRPTRVFSTAVMHIYVVLDSCLLGTLVLIVERQRCLYLPACLTAGASQHALAADTTGEVAQQLLDINTLAPIRLTQAVLPYMLKR